MKKSFVSLSLCALLFPLAALTACAGAPYEAGCFETAEDVREIVLDLAERSVEFVVAEGAGLRVDYYENEQEYYDIRLAEGRLTMTLRRDKDWTDYFGVGGERSRQTVVVRLPSARLANLTVRTSNRDVVLPALDIVGTCRVEVNHGDIRLTGLAVGEALELATKNGGVAGTLVGSYDLFRMDIAVAKGSSNLMRKEEGEKLLKIAVNKGDVSLKFVAPGAAG